MLSQSVSYSSSLSCHPRGSDLCFNDQCSKQEQDNPLHVTYSIASSDRSSQVLHHDIDNNIQSPLRLFADDTILYREIWSKDDHNIIQNDIQTLFKWSQTWKLDFNVTKCKVLTISNKKDPDKFNYTLNDPLEHVDSHQYLGVTINSKLRWNTHVSAITAKATLMSYAAPYTPAILK